eukprot:245330_1
MSKHVVLYLICHFYILNANPTTAQTYNSSLQYIPNCGACNATLTACEGDIYCNHITTEILNIGEGEIGYAYTQYINALCVYFQDPEGGNVSDACVTQNPMDVYECITSNECFQIRTLDDIPGYSCAACSTENNACDNEQSCYLFVNYTTTMIGLNGDTTQLEYEQIVNTYWCVF